MISNIFTYEILRFARIFNPDLRQLRIKSTLFTSRHPDFYVLHAVVFLTLIGLWIRLGSFQTLHKCAHGHQRTFWIMITTRPQLNATFSESWRRFLLHTRAWHFTWDHQKARRGIAVSVSWSWSLISV